MHRWSRRQAPALVWVLWPQEPELFVWQEQLSLARQVLRQVLWPQEPLVWQARQPQVFYIQGRNPSGVS